MSTEVSKLIAKCEDVARAAGEWEAMLYYRGVEDFENFCLLADEALGRVDSPGADDDLPMPEHLRARFGHRWPSTQPAPLYHYARLWQAFSEGTEDAWFYVFDHEIDPADHYR